MNIALHQAIGRLGQYYFKKTDTHDNTEKKANYQDE